MLITDFTAGKKTYGLIVPLVAIFLALGPRSGAADTGPADFIQSLGDRAIAILQTPGNEKVERRAQFRGLFSEGFDLDTIGKFVLGRYWRSATPE